jgi:YrbI family 3-deoxy-D-manno-octulosonate 8-phosphate phosphatase
MSRPTTSSPEGLVVVVIPARGGSKGVVGKNLRRVGGVPLVSRAIGAARASRLVDSVYVSTDDEAIAAQASADGARVVSRPAPLSGDEATSESALLHALDQLDAEPGILVFLQATSPFIDPVDLDAAIARVQSGESDVVFSARASHGFLWRSTDTGAVGINHDHSSRGRRQDSEPQYLETGAFYVMRAAGFRAAGFRFFGRVGIRVVADLTAIEIDSEDDLLLAGAIAAISEAPTPIAVAAVVTDFDGVHTDNSVIVGPDGIEFVTASRSDGMGVELLKNASIPVLILSKETHPVVAARATKLGVQALQATDDKRSALVEWAAVTGVSLSDIAYLGNDVNDLECMASVGWPVAVADAHPAVLVAARVILSHSGGHGAVRELADRVLAGRSPDSPPAEEQQ